MAKSVKLAKKEAEREVLREYYLEKNFFASAAGVLKALSIVACASLAALALGGGRTAGAGAAGSAALLKCALCAAHCMRLAAYAPMTCFYTDIIVSCAVGAWLLLNAVLGPVFWGMQGILDYVHMLLAIVSSTLVSISAVITYMAVIKRWDAMHKPTPALTKPNQTELDV